MRPTAEPPNAVRIEPGDNVVTLLRAVRAGAAVRWDGGQLPARGDVPVSHKVAIAPIVSGAQVIKYGQPIGRAAADIAPGEHVHTHNLSGASTEI